MANPQHPTETLLGEIQSEIAPEASPMLAFLARHARSLAAFVVCFILVIAGFAFYESQTKKTRNADVLQVGQLLSIPEPAERLKALESYLPGVPKALRNQILFGLALTAQEMKDYPKQYAAWEQLRDTDPALKLPGTMGMVQALAAQKKEKEALPLLESLLQGLDPAAIPLVNEKIAVFAELTGDYARAALACEALAANPAAGNSALLWQQKAAQLRLGLQASK